jgi:hypothetical protein
MKAPLGPAGFGDPRPRVYYDARALVPHPRFNMLGTLVGVAARPWWRHFPG